MFRLVLGVGFQQWTISMSSSSSLKTQVNSASQPALALLCDKQKQKVKKSIPLHTICCCDKRNSSTKGDQGWL